jgi:hypothetical protein
MSCTLRMVVRILQLFDLGEFIIWLYRYATGIQLQTTCNADDTRASPFPSITEVVNPWTFIVSNVQVPMEEGYRDTHHTHSLHDTTW